MSLTEYDTTEIINLAYAAHRVNNGYQKTTQRHSEDIPTIWSNKELIRYSLSAQQHQNLVFVPADFVPLTVTDADIDRAQEVSKHFRKYTFQILGDSLSDFQKDVFSAISSEKVSFQKIGLIAYVPELVSREIKELTYQKLLKSEYHDSQVLSVPTFQGMVKILKVVPLSLYDTTLYIGGHDGNLFSFATKKQLAENQHYDIIAKIKRPGIERSTGLPLTNLNYVKILK